MNALLELKKPFNRRPGSNAGGPPSIPRNGSLSSEDCRRLADALEFCRKQWPLDSPIGDTMLIDVQYRGIVAKSNRIRMLFRDDPQTPVNDYIVGARFAHDEQTGDICHVITYKVTKQNVDETVILLRQSAECIDIADKYFANGTVTSTELDTFNAKYKKTPKLSMAKTLLAQTIKDVYYVRSFSIPQVKVPKERGASITLFDTGISITDLVRHLGFDVTSYQELDRRTLIVNDPALAEAITRETGYLISMSHGLADLSAEPQIFPLQSASELSPTVPKPSNEPIIGVIDTRFDKSSYFNEWVEYRDCISSIPKSNTDTRHGTEVSSIIVDGPTLNPQLDDGCGRFRVRHFGVAVEQANSMLTIMDQIRSIVPKNLDIKVWNLSLGTDAPVNPNSISPLAALLDDLQYRYDVIFVVAGTNVPVTAPNRNMTIGSPADSINSLVVNACDYSGTMAADYDRHGPVLSFFHKPDIAYYGGDKTIPMQVWSNSALCEDQGTSFAAPWIARKLAYLIEVMGFSRETAKALIIDSACSWTSRDNWDWTRCGFGIPPVSIEDIVSTANNEIRFILTGNSQQYETYQLQLPVPRDDKDKYPFIARATLCYSPQCDRNQGVDYTKTELDLHFGRVKPPKRRTSSNTTPLPSIESINGNRQADFEEYRYLPEESARQHYRKWDNVKHISDIERTRFAARKNFTEDGFWGISLRAKERWENRPGEPSRNLRFSVVVTLKEMYGKNRIEDFKRLCMVYGWVVNNVEIANRVNVYQEAEAEISFED